MPSKAGLHRLTRTQADALKRLLDGDVLLRVPNGNYRALDLFEWYSEDGDRLEKTERIQPSTIEALASLNLTEEKPEEFKIKLKGASRVRMTEKGERIYNLVANLDAEDTKA